MTTSLSAGVGGLLLNCLMKFVHNAQQCSIAILCGWKTNQSITADLCCN